jgi:hypothetical protein
MRQPAFFIATLGASLLFGASAAGAFHAGIALPPAQPPAAGVVAKHDVPTVALAASIADQFPGHAVSVQLDDPAIEDASAVQQQVQALARVRIDGSAPMLVRATALYDHDSRSIDAPSLFFEATGARPAAPAVDRSLAAEATRRLGAEFAGQPVSLSLLGADAVPVGGRYLRVVARGTADFGGEGRAATMVEALYDPRTGDWLHLDYELGADPAAGGDGLAYAGD